MNAVFFQSSFSFYSLFKLFLCLLMKFNSHTAVIAPKNILLSIITFRKITRESVMRCYLQSVLFYFSTFLRIPQYVTSNQKDSDFKK